MIAPIQQITPLSIGGQERELYHLNDNQGMFASVFQTAIDNVRNTEEEVVHNEYLLSTGQLDNPAILTISETKSAMAVELLVQLRNKALDAYSELTRINL